jgi:predicted aldo/keto reductase-like oxidoreductase
VDTALMYHEYHSELLVGKALQDGYRGKVFLATKSPDDHLHVPEDFDKVLGEQLEKLQTDHVDFYMFHGINHNSWNNKVKGFKLLDRMEKAKADGRIRHIGFSFHDNAEAFREIIDGYGHWDFCQIQMNYLDVEHQATIKGMEYAASKGIAVVVMEPLLGGKLANPTSEMVKRLDPSKSPVEWALDFLWNRPEVSLLLSGMGDETQVRQNIEYASRSSVGMLKTGDLDMLDETRSIYETKAFVPCTKCRYCMPCPAGVDIPGVYEIYNHSAIDNKKAIGEYAAFTGGKADLCIRCGKCLAACPQKIDSPELMPKIAEALKAPA